MNIGNMFEYNILSWQIFWMLLTFSIIYLYMKILFVPKIEYNLKIRANHLNHLNTELQHLKHEIYTIESAYLEQSANLERDIKEHIEQLYDKYQHILHETKKHIEQEVLKQKNELQLQLKKHTLDLQQSFEKYSNNIVEQYDMTHIQ